LTHAEKLREYDATIRSLQKQVDILNREVENS
jgi:hypothetical protein